VRLCRTFAYEAIGGMLAPCAPRGKERERDDGGALQEDPFPPDVMLMGVCWDVVSPLKTRHGEARMLARDVHVEHSPVNRWVVTYSPQLTEAFHRRTRPV
jgi:transposase-like protein